MGKQHVDGCCQWSQQALLALLENARYGMYEAAFDSFFFRANRRVPLHLSEAGITFPCNELVRCVKCGHTLDEHSVRKDREIDAELSTASSRRSGETPAMVASVLPVQKQLTLTPESAMSPSSPPSGVGGRSSASPPHRTREDHSHLPPRGLDPLPRTRRRPHKIVLVGDSGVGKTSFIKRVASSTHANSGRFGRDASRFSELYVPTIGYEIHPVSVSLNSGDVGAFRSFEALATMLNLPRPSAHPYSDADPEDGPDSGGSVDFEVWDCAGRDASASRSAFRGAQGIVVAFDANNLMTFRHAQRWATRVMQANDSDTTSSSSDIKSIPIVFIACKSDLKGPCASSSASSVNVDAEDEYCEATMSATESALFYVSARCQDDDEVLAPLQCLAHKITSPSRESDTQRFEKNKTYMRHMLKRLHQNCRPTDSSQPLPL